MRQTLHRHVPPASGASAVAVCLITLRFKFDQAACKRNPSADPVLVRETPVTLRMATADDVHIVRGLRLQMLAESPTAFDADYDTAHALDDAGWREWVSVSSSDQDRAVWIVEAGPEYVGMVAAGIVADECRIGALWVAPRMRGAGIGGSLLDAAETWCHNTRCRWNVLSVSEENAAAQRLYLRRGYAFTGASKPTKWGHRELYMRKPCGKW